MMDNYKKIINLLQKLTLDAMLISNGNNIRYISGFAGATGYLYISGNRHTLVTDFRYTIQAEHEAEGYEIITIGSGGYEEVLNDLIRTDKPMRLGFEAEDMLYSTYQNLKDKLAVEELVPIGNEITQLRRIKTAKELEYIKKAEKIGDQVFTEILDFIKPGMTELEIAAQIEFLLKMRGAEGLSFSSIVASGLNSSMPHAVPSRKRIEAGDFVTMDFGCVYEGYCSDMTRTIVIGKASERQREIYRVVLEAQTQALSFIKAGYRGSEVDRVARDIIYKAGFEGCFGHGLGHSVGLEVHENPRLNMSDESILLPGMIETVEPGIYIKGYGGVRIEDLVAVTEDGCENFTHSKKELIEL
jgi:Xaa-Pro aminopeptidase